jgi:carbohydrate diacid regulator
LHRNTLLYRIEKINRVTKLNIRNFDDAMTFKILTLLYDKMGDRLGRK